MRSDVCYNQTINYIPTIKCREYDKTIIDVNDMKNLIVKIEEDGYVKEYAIDFKKLLKDYGIENVNPVYDADGEEINIGDIVYGLSDGKEWRVAGIIPGNYPVDAISGDDVRQLKPEWLTHHEPDTQDKIDSYLEDESSISLAHTLTSDGMYSRMKMVPWNAVQTAMQRQRELDKRLFGGNGGN